MKILTPELDKMRSVHERSQSIGEFLEWLGQEKGVVLAEYGSGNHNDVLFAKHCNKENLLAEFFGIDLQKVDDERRAILDSVRAS